MPTGELKGGLYKNSVCIFLASVGGAGFGFFFWMLAAKICSSYEVGIATTLIAVVNFSVLLSRFGFDYSIIRFFEEERKDVAYSTSSLFTIMVAAPISAVAIAVVGVLREGVSFGPIVLCVVLATVSLASLTSIAGIVFIAMGRSDLYLGQNLVQGGKVVLVLFLASFGALGIVVSLAIPLLAAYILSVIVLSRMGIRYSHLDTGFLKKTFGYSAGNYATSLLSLAPIHLFPIMVMATLGSVETSYYYIAYAIASLVFFIPSAFGISMFVEGSHGASMRSAVTRGILGMLGLLAPIVIAVALLADDILSLIGEEYAVAADLLIVFVCSSFLQIPFVVYSSLKRVRKEMSELLVVTSVNFVLLISAGYLLLLQFGTIGIGYSWVLSYGITSAIIVLASVKRINSEEGMTGPDRVVD